MSELPTRIALDGARPEISESGWVASGAFLVGQVSIGPRSSVWFNAVLRADGDAIRVGADTNLQDGVIVHADPGVPVDIGDRVSVGHRAVLHGCTIEDDVLVGMGALVLNGARLGAGSLIAAGAVVLEGTDVPAGSLVAGVPAKVRRALTESELMNIRANATNYVRLARRYAEM